MSAKNCKLCDSFIKRHHAIDGIGNINANVMFIFDHPRYKQDKTGLFKSGADIVKFMNYLSSVGFDEFNTYYTHLVKCKPIGREMFANSINICTNEHLSKQYIVNGNKKKVIVTVGRDVSDYMFMGKNYKYFHVYTIDTIVIPIPSVTFFIKGGVLNIRKLRNLKTFCDSVN